MKENSTAKIPPTMTIAQPAPSRALAAFWLIYLLFVFIEPYLGHQSWQYWAIAAASIVLFVPLYFTAFRRGLDRPELARWYALAMVVLGIVLVPVNIGGATYVIFAASIVAFAFQRRRDVVLAVVGMTALLTAAILLSRPHFEWWMLFQPLVVLTVGGGNVLVAEERRRTAVVRRAQEEVEEMAKVAERERIARDLHDLLGHTLSVIALKAELAAKLSVDDPQRAAQEIRDVEQVSREALTEVRHAIEGFRNKGFAGELWNARRALDAAGITLEADVEPMAAPPRQETVLALILREAVTNVIRHAGATRCRITLAADASDIALVVEDDGRGGEPVYGNGLAGMRERVTAAAGSIVISGERGMRVSVRLPLMTAAGARS